MLMESLLVVNFVLILVSFVSVKVFGNLSDDEKIQVPRKWIQDLSA